MILLTIKKMNILTVFAQQKSLLSNFLFLFACELNQDYHDRINLFLLNNFTYSCYFLPLKLNFLVKTFTLVQYFSYIFILEVFQIESLKKVFLIL